MSLITEFSDFLTRLGLTIDAGRKGHLTARRRTALMEEELHYILSEDGSAEPQKRATLIIPSGAPAPRNSDRGRWFHFDDFLDHAVQADRIAREAADVSFDPVVKESLRFFVPQQVSESSGSSPRDAVQFVFSNWLPAPSGKLLVVLGPAGYGKTLLTYHTARQLAQAHLASRSSPKQPIPFLVPFARFRRVADFEGMILTSLQQRGITDLTAGAFAYLVSRQRVILFLDGFDELLEERPTEAQKNLREFLETLQGRGKVLITARSTFFRTSLDVADFLEHYLEPDDVQVVELLPFNKNQRGEVIAKVSPGQAEINRVTRVVESDGIREAMGSPLLLRETVEAMVQEHAKLPPNPSRRDLFEVLESSVYGRERKRHGHLFTNRVQQSMLQSLGGDMLRENTRAFEMDLVRVVASEAAEETNPSDAELEKLADHHFLTVDAQAGDVRFNHQVFREYFQARWLVHSLETGDQHRVVEVLGRRLLPEGVATFVTELSGEKAVENLIGCMAPQSSSMLIDNIGSICASLRDPLYLRRFFELAPRETALTIRVEETDLSRADLGSRVLGRTQFVNCSLAGASFRGSVLRDVAFHGCDLTGAVFEGASPEIVTLDYTHRLFGAPSIFRALIERGAYCGPDFEVIEQEATVTWRTTIKELIRSRLRRFYVAGPAAEGSRWDVSIRDRNLLGGLDQSSRMFVLADVIPAMVGLGILKREREHGEVIYRLQVKARDDARALIERDQEVGLVAELVERLS
jgi:hypothetical protein